MTELGRQPLRQRLQTRPAGSAARRRDQFAAPAFDRDGNGLVFSDFLNLFLFDAKNNLGGVIKALQNKGLFQSLAEPNLIAENGKEASFLAGGEYPVSRRAGPERRQRPSPSSSRSSASG